MATGTNIAALLADMFGNRTVSPPDKQEAEQDTAPAAVPDTSTVTPAGDVTQAPSSNTPPPSVGASAPAAQAPLPPVAQPYNPWASPANQNPMLQGMIQPTSKADFLPPNYHSGPSLLNLALSGGAGNLAQKIAALQNADTAQNSNFVNAMRSYYDAAQKPYELGVTAAKAQAENQVAYARLGQEMAKSNQDIYKELSPFGGAREAYAATLQRLPDGIRNPNFMNELFKTMQANGISQDDQAKVVLAREQQARTEEALVNARVGIPAAAAEHNAQTNIGIPAAASLHTAEAAKARMPTFNFNPVTGTGVMSEPATGRTSLLGGYSGQQFPIGQVAPVAGFGAGGGLAGAGGGGVARGGGASLSPPMLAAPALPSSPAASSALQTRPAAPIMPPTAPPIWQNTPSVGAPAPAPAPMNNTGPSGQTNNGPVGQLNGAPPPTSGQAPGLPANPAEFMANENAARLQTQRQQASVTKDDELRNVTNNKTLDEINQVAASATDSIHSLNQIINMNPKSTHVPDMLVGLMSRILQVDPNTANSLGITQEAVDNRMMSDKTRADLVRQYVQSLRGTGRILDKEFSSGVDKALVTMDTNPGSIQAVASLLRTNLINRLGAARDATQAYKTYTSNPGNNPAKFDLEQAYTSSIQKRYLQGGEVGVRQIDPASKRVVITPYDGSKPYYEDSQ